MSVLEASQARAVDYVNGASAADVAAKIDAPDPKLLFPFDMAAIKDGRLSR